MRAPSTERGRAVVERIVDAAARCFQRQGLDGTSLDDILEEASAGRGQFYRYFDSRDELVPIVLDRQADAWVVRHAGELGNLATFDGIERFADALVEVAVGARLRRWCPIGLLAADVITDRTQTHHRALAAAFRRMAGHLHAGLATMVDEGRLSPEVDPARLAMAFLACFEGGLLLAVSTGDEHPLRDALDAAIGLLRSHAVDPAARATRGA